MLFARRNLVVAVLAMVMGLTTVGLAEAGNPSTNCYPPPACELPIGFPMEQHVQVFLRSGTLVIVGTSCNDLVTIRRFNGVTLGATPTYQVYVNGGCHPVLTFPVFDGRTGQRVSHIFMDGNAGFDRLRIEDAGRWQISTREVEQRVALRPAG